MVTIPFKRRGSEMDSLLAKLGWTYDNGKSVHDNVVRALSAMYSRIMDNDKVIEKYKRAN